MSTQLTDTEKIAKIAAKIELLHSKTTPDNWWGEIMKLMNSAEEILGTEVMERAYLSLVEEGIIQEAI